MNHLENKKSIRKLSNAIQAGSIIIIFVVLFVLIMFVSIVGFVCGSIML